MGRLQLESLFDEGRCKLALSLSWSQSHSGCVWGPPGVNEEAPEGVDDRVCSFRTKTIDPRVAGREIDEGKSVFVTARTSSFAVPNIHTYGMKRMPGSGKEFAVTVTVDGGHIPNG